MQWLCQWGNLFCKMPLRRQVLVIGRRRRHLAAYSGIKIAGLALISRLSLPGELWAMRFRLSTCLAVLALALSAIPGSAETVVRYGISMADIPLTTGQPDRGAGAYQFTAYT